MQAQTRQQNKLQMALDELKARKLTMEQVRRVAVERTGDIHIEVHEAGLQRFFVYKAGELQELWPQEDSKIPLALKLANDKFAGGHMIISYRPGRRIVLGPMAGEQGHIIKGFRKRRAAHAAGLYATAISVCEQTGFDIPGLLQYIRKDDCLVMARRSGQPPELDDGSVETWSEIGSSLRQFQNTSRLPELTVGLPDFGHLDELAVLDERARRLLLCVPDLPGRWLSGRQRLESAAMDLPPDVAGLTHRDLHDGQFIVSGNTISLLDFDLLCLADVALDAGNLLAHMKLRELQGRAGVDGASVSACEEAFLSGLGRQDEPGFEQHLLFYKATCFYRLALLYSLRPRWQHLTEALIGLGAQCIGALGDLKAGS